MFSCSKKSEPASDESKSTTATPAPSVKEPPAAPKMTLEKLQISGDKWTATHTASLDYWSVAKRTNKLSRDPSGWYQYTMTIEHARPDVPTTETDLKAKALAGELEKGSKFFTVDRVEAVKGGFAVIGQRGSSSAAESAADKGFFVARDLGNGTRILCTPSSTNPGSNDEIIAEAIAVCASATL